MPGYEAEEIAWSDMSPQQQIAREIVKHTVAPILHWVEKPEVSEIAINRPTEVWLKLRKPDDNGNVWVRRPDPALDRQTMETILHVLANVTNMRDFGPQGNPVTHGSLPGGHRYCGGYGPNLQYYSGEMDVAGTAIFVCRQYQRGRNISFSDYGLERGQELPHYDLVGDRKADGADPITRLLNSISRGDHIMISGGTDTGKTTLMNSMLRRLDSRLRILSVQDTPEINLEQPNHLHIMMQRQGAATGFTYKSVVDLITRSTPDVVVAGEISTTNAATIWELMRGGHGSFMTTIHAENVAGAISTFMTRISHTAEGEVRDRERVAMDMRDMLRVVQIVKDPMTNKRTIVQIS